VLASGAASGDVVESVAYLPRGLSDGYTKAEADARYMDINSVPTPAAVSDAANTSTGYFALPAGTTAQRPGSAAVGYTRMNTTTGSVEFYDGTNWVSTNLIPVINSISGTIYVGVSSTLTLSLTNATDTIDVKYYEGGTLLATDSGVTVTSGSATSTVPSAVYGQTGGDTISIQVFNQDGTPSSNSVNKTVAGLPTGGTITTTGSYRVHTFTSSSSFVVPSGVTLSDVEYLVIAGGGGGGSTNYSGGGGGAGGYRNSVVGESSGGSSSAEARLTLSANTYTVTVGGGGPGSNSGNGVSGSNSVFGSITSTGGGYGGGGIGQNGASGGSGGASSGNWSTPTAASGTSGQGTSGGIGANASPGYGGGGGGGAGTSGGNATASVSGNGGNGLSSSITGSSVTRAGGGGGGTESGTIGTGGSGGGGNGADYPANGGSGTANTGSGGGGADTSASGGNGGSGIVIVRYQL